MTKPKLTAEHTFCERCGPAAANLQRKVFEAAAERLDDECVTNEHEGREQAAAEDSRMAEVFRALAK